MRRDPKVVPDFRVRGNDSSVSWREKQNFGEGDGSRGREKNLGKGTARSKKTIAKVLKSEIRVFKLLNNFYQSQVSK